VSKWRIYVLAIIDGVHGIRRRDVYRYEQHGKGGAWEWHYKGLEANDWLSRALLKSQ
jgi:hypothetical protein